MFYNVANNLAERRNVHCFYLKSGQNKIYERSNVDDFATEHVFHQDFDYPPARLQYITRADESPYKFKILGLYSNGNAFQLMSDCFYLFQTGVFINFSGIPDGDIENLNDWECAEAENFTPELHQMHEGFANYPTGTVNYPFNSGLNTSGGYVYSWA